RWLQVEVPDLNLSWFVSVQNAQLVVAKQAQPDVIFRGNTNELILIAARVEDPDTLFFQRRLTIEGDTELGLYVKNLLDALDMEQMPKPLQALLQQLAQFIQKGLAAQPAANTQAITSC
ncbi:MAG: ubiquinone anaerobic biosynthesis accessory factor UbiT, partial [Plesiomonas shigelloides]